jgi:mannose-1-phosphate guanylyltransferase/phosphomannomutase
MDIGTTASPVTEFTIAQKRAAGGVHVRAAGDVARAVFYDPAGRPVPRDLQRKLEKACVGQDFARATPEAAGTIERLTMAEWAYLEHLARQVQAPAIRAAGLTVAVEVQAWPVLRHWLDRLGCQVVAEGGRVRLALDPMEATWRLGDAPPEAMVTLEVWLGLRGAPGGEVAIPVTAPRAVEELLRRAGRQPVRVRQADWHTGDPLLAMGRLLEWMVLEHMTEADVLGSLPAAHTAVRVVDCPWEAKGRVMRRLLEACEGSVVDMVDGLRIQEESGWALLLPDPDEPVYRIYTEAADPAGAEELAEAYVGRVRDLQAQ